MLGDRASSALAGTRFTELSWVAETGSTNSDLLDLARRGAPEGMVLVADHQRSGRGRQGRAWLAPPGASLLVSMLLRPPAELAGLVTMAVGVAAVDALDAVAGIRARLKWPNDLVWPGDGGAEDRKLGGILAEADWPAGGGAGSEGASPNAGGQGRPAVVVGLGCNTDWPAELPRELAATATACNLLTGVAPDREALLVALLARLEAVYGLLLAGGRDEVVGAWRSRSATLGRRVRVALGRDEVVGVAVDVDLDGRLVLELAGGRRASFAAGDVVHLRPAPRARG